MQSLWIGMKKYGVEREELKRPQVVRHYAEGAKLLDEYNLFWRIHSKYAHPSSYLLFGRKNIVFGKEPKNFFLVCAQYFAAKNLRDLNKMIEASAE